MKKLLTLILTTLSLNLFSQFPITENFINGMGTWTSYGGAGYQTYGPSDGFMTFNIGTTPYPNGTTLATPTVYTLSPVYNFSSCSSNPTVSFSLSGWIETGWDYVYLQYFNGSVWTTIASFTGIQNSVYNYVLPLNTTRLRFVLDTDGSYTGYNDLDCPSIISCEMATYFYYGCSWCSLIGCYCSNVYYYDIDYVTVNCSVILPIEFNYFTVDGDESPNLYWSIESDKAEMFEVQKLNKKMNRRGELSWETLTQFLSNGQNEFSFRPLNYDSLEYYRVVSTDVNGEKTYSKILAWNLVDDDRSISCYVNNTNLMLNGFSSGQIFDLNGRVITNFNQTQQIDISGLSKGLYIVRSSETKDYFKFIKD